MGDYSQLLKAEKQKKPQEHLPSPAPRVPSDVPEHPDVTGVVLDEFVNKSTSEQINKSTNQQVNTSTSVQVSKETNQQINKSTKRFGTYLTEESIRAMKRLAFESDKNDYEVFQEAVDAYLKAHGY